MVMPRAQLAAHWPLTHPVGGARGDDEEGGFQSSAEFVYAEQERKRETDTRKYALRKPIEIVFCVELSLKTCVN